MTDLSAFSLETKTIAVTGANTGIGQGIALAAARAGARIIGIGRSSMDETAAAIDALGGDFIAVSADLADAEARRDLIDRMWTEHGALDGLVNNAGIIRRADAVEFSEDDWRDVLDVNLTAMFVLCRGFARRAFADQRAGKIVNIASLLSFQGGIRVPAYAASKHGVSGLTQALSNEWAAHGIGVNAIAPGYIESNNTEALRADPDRSASILARIPAGRWGKPADIGDAAVFLLARASDYMHGTVVPVDGGWLAR